MQITLELLDSAKGADVDNLEKCSVCGRKAKYVFLIKGNFDTFINSSCRRLCTFLIKTNFSYAPMAQLSNKDIFYLKCK